MNEDQTDLVYVGKYINFRNLFRIILFVCLEVCPVFLLCYHFCDQWTKNICVGVYMNTKNTCAGVYKDCQQR